MKKLRKLYQNRKVKSKPLRLTKNRVNELSFLNLASGLEQDMYSEPLPKMIGLKEMVYDVKYPQPRPKTDFEKTFDFIQKHDLDYDLRSTDGINALVILKLSFDDSGKLIEGPRH